MDTLANVVQMPDVNKSSEIKVDFNIKTQLISYFTNLMQINEETELISKNTLDKYILAIDVGIVHLGLVLLRISEESEIVRIVNHELIDIRKFKHRQVGIRECQLGHTSSVTDWMAHVYQEYHFIFSTSFKIYVERQPLTGLQSVQESIFARFRDKVELISPNEMHTHFKLSDDYSVRKIETTQLASKYFFSIDSLDVDGRAREDANRELFVKFQNYKDKLEPGNITRSHDVADAICIAAFALHKENQKYKAQQRKFHTLNSVNQLSQFRRKPIVRSPYFKYLRKRP